jgi:hypothetical protein
VQEHVKLKFEKKCNLHCLGAIGTFGIHRTWEIDLQEKGGELHEEDSNGVGTCDRNAVQHSICGRF